MTIATQTVEDMLRPLAERAEECPMLTDHMPGCEYCHGTGRILDKRFQALRCQHLSRRFTYAE